MKLPKQVQAQADKAAALEQSLAQPPATPGVVGDVTQLVTPPPADQVPTPAPAPVEPPAQQLPAADPKPPKVEDFEHKYRVLQGINRKTADELAEAKRQLAELSSKVETLTKQPPEPPKKPAADPKDVETFGADMIAMVQRYAEQTFDALAQRFSQAFTAAESRIAALEQGLTGVTQQTTLTLEQAYWAELERLVPDLEQLNVDPAFLAYLGEVDPVFRAPRQAALAAAEKALDAKGVAAVFQAFKATRQAPVSTPNPLSSQIAPSAAATAAPPAPAQSTARVTVAQINQFYDDIRRGKYVGREAEAQQIEAAINRAAAEGRVIE